MKKLMTICLLAIASVLGTSAQSIYDVKVKNDVEQDVSLSDYKGKVLLIVNTATRCGFTPQYKELETLYEKYHAECLEEPSPSVCRVFETRVLPECGKAGGAWFRNRSARYKCRQCPSR